MTSAAKYGVIVVVVVAAAAAAYRPALSYWQNRNRPNFRTAEVAQGELTAVVNATGVVRPVLSVVIGSFVSGPIVELPVDFNQEVRTGDLLARVDPRIYEAAVERDRAILVTRQAEVERVEAQRQQALNELKRIEALRTINPQFVSETQLDQHRFQCQALEAELRLAHANVEQARANLSNSDANLAYTEIRSPVDGVVIDRKIDPGQTLAAQFQAPELFVVAPEMDEKMHIHASVDEADIGQILAAQRDDRPVTFTVDAYRDQLFEGRIDQVRLSSATVQNVVTYPVIVAAPNPERKLLPGMTASLSFEVERRGDVLMVPNAALRFYPERDHVREEDRGLLDGAPRPPDVQEVVRASAQQKVDAVQQGTRRHVWVEDPSGLLRAIEIATGISDYQFTELISGDLQASMSLVTGIQRN